MASKKQPANEVPEMPPIEVTLDLIKYNLYLNFKATCASVIAQTSDLKDAKDIAIEADRLAQYLQSARKVD